MIIIIFNERLNKDILTATLNWASRGLECQLRGRGIDIVWWPTCCYEHCCYASDAGTRREAEEIFFYYRQFGINYSGPPIDGNVFNKIIRYRSEYRGPGQRRGKSSSGKPLLYVDSKSPNDLMTLDRRLWNWQLPVDNSRLITLNDGTKDLRL